MMQQGHNDTNTASTTPLWLPTLLHRTSISHRGIRLSIPASVVILTPKNILKICLGSRLPTSVSMSNLKLLQTGARSLQNSNVLHSSICRALSTRLVLEHPLLSHSGPSRTRSRFQSTSSRNDQPPRRFSPKAPPPSVGAIFSAAARSTGENVKNLFRPTVLRQAYQKNPGEMILALVL
jgi:hypothetical protein